MRFLPKKGKERANRIKADIKRKTPQDVEGLNN